MLSCKYLCFVVLKIILIHWTHCVALVNNEAASSTMKGNLSGDEASTTIDPSGYIIFCPCMGRFGNQAEHYLGAIAFAKSINRTLILPPWRTYKNVRFDEWFQVSPLKSFHRVLVAEDFLDQLAPVIWPDGSRTGLCFSYSNGQCEMKSGNPFGPFWDELGVDFDNTEIYSIGYAAADSDEWSHRFPPARYPVLALKGAPASYPIKRQHVSLHKYLVWSEKIQKEVDEVMRTKLLAQPFVGIHLRNGPDWEVACSHVKTDPEEGHDEPLSQSYMASYQCLGHNGEHGKVTRELCLPKEEDILRLTWEVVKDTGVKYVYVATDKYPMIAALTSHLSDLEVTVIHHDPHLPQIDLAVLARAQHFVGNCVSSMSSFVYRERLVKGLPTSYFSFGLTK